MTNIIRGQRATMNMVIDYPCPQELLERIDPPKKVKVATGCPYCEDWTTQELHIKSNADLSRTLALIAQGDKKKEIVFHNNGVSYGIEIDYCPKCGRKLI